MICGNCFTEVTEEGAKTCPTCGNDLSTSNPPDTLPVGTILGGRYILGMTLEQGGFGITYKTLDHKTGDVVALKEYFPQSICKRGGEASPIAVVPVSGEAEAEFRSGKERFFKRARMLVERSDKADHAGVQECFEENGTAYLVTALPKDDARDVHQPLSVERSGEDKTHGTDQLSSDTYGRVGGIVGGMVGHKVGSQIDQSKIKHKRLVGFLSLALVLVIGTIVRGAVHDATSSLEDSIIGSHGSGYSSSSVSTAGSSASVAGTAQTAADLDGTWSLEQCEASDSNDSAAQEAADAYAAQLDDGSAAEFMVIRGINVRHYRCSSGAPVDPVHGTISVSGNNVTISYDDGTSQDLVFVQPSLKYQAASGDGTGGAVTYTLLRTSKDIQNLTARYYWDGDWKTTSVSTLQSDGRAEAADDQYAVFLHVQGNEASIYACRRGEGIVATETGAIQVSGDGTSARFTYQRQDNQDVVYYDDFDMDSTRQTIHCTEPGSTEDGEYVPGVMLTMERADASASELAAAF